MKRLNQLSLGMLLLFGLIAFGAGTANAQSQSLRWNLQKGQAFKLSMQQDMTQKMQIPGLGPQEMPMKQDVDMTWNVVESDEDSFTIEQIVSRVQLSVKSAFMNIDFDSDDGEPKDAAAKQMYESMKDVIGKKTLRKLNRRGETIEGKEEAGAAGPGSEMLKNVSGQVALALPEGSLEVGKTWDTSFDMNMNGMAMKSKNTFKYVGTEKVDGKDLHKFEVNIVTDIEGGPQGAEVSIKDQEHKGVIYFDAEEGRLVSSKATQKLSMELSIQGQNLEQELDGTTNVTMTPIKK